MTEQQKQTIFEPAKVIAVGIAAPIASLLTSRFGIAGTMLGLAISAVILTVLVDALKVYLARASTKVVKVPSGLRTELSRQSIRGRLRALLTRVLTFPPRSLSPKRRRSILVGSLLAAGISFLVGLMVITGVEASVGKSISCWLWNDCPTEESSTDGGSPSSTRTLPSIFGGGPSATNGAPAVRPAAPQHQPTPPGPPESPSVSPSVAPESEGQSSGVPDQSRDRSSSREDDQQESLPDYSDEDQQQSSPDYSDEGYQQSPSNAPEESSQELPQGEDQSSNPPGTAQDTRASESYSVPWTT